MTVGGVAGPSVYRAAQQENAFPRFAPGPLPSTGFDHLQISTHVTMTEEPPVAQEMWLSQLCNEPLSEFRVEPNPWLPRPQRLWRMRDLFCNEYKTLSPSLCTAPSKMHKHRQSTLGTLARCSRRTSPSDRQSQKTRSLTRTMIVRNFTHHYVHSPSIVHSSDVTPPV